MSDDERDEEHGDYEMREPNFARVLNVNSRADQRDGRNHTEHGDPIRWGAGADVRVEQSNAIVYTEQIIRVDRITPYPCNWQMVGTLAMPLAWYGSPLESQEWAGYLEILMGTGQTMITHIVNLRALINLAADPSMLETGKNWYLPQLMGANAVLPWVLPGGVIGKSIQVRGMFVGLFGETGINPATLRLTAEVSPFNAGDRA